MVKRVIVGLLAVLLLLGSVVAGAVAVWAYQVFGSAGVMRFDAGTITPSADASATVIDIERFGATVPYLAAFGTTTLAVASPERGDPADTLFIGAGDTSDVDAYLKGSTYSVALRDGSEWVVRDVPGVATAAPPRDEDFWLAEAVGRPAALSVPEVRPLTVVIMHPSGVPSGPLVLSIDFSVPDIATWMTWLGVAAALLLTAGVTLLVFALRRPASRGRHAAGVVRDAGPVPAGEVPTVEEPADDMPEAEEPGAADEPR